MQAGNLDLDRLCTGAVVGRAFIGFRDTKDGLRPGYMP